MCQGVQLEYKDYCTAFICIIQEWILKRELEKKKLIWDPKIQRAYYITNTAKLVLSPN